jgi:hypothetical protein
MIEIALVISSMLIPIMSIVFFVIGYNVNAPKKLLFRGRKPKKTEYERKMEQIDNVSLKGE